MMTAMTITKTDRLNIGSHVAPVLRRRALNARRVVKVVNQLGNVVRVIDDIDLAKAVLERADIAFGVVGSQKLRTCKRCQSRYQYTPGASFILCAKCTVDPIVAVVSVQLRGEWRSALAQHLETTAVDVVLTERDWAALFGWLVVAARKFGVQAKIRVRMTASQYEVFRGLQAQFETYLRQARIYETISDSMVFVRAVGLQLLGGTLGPGEPGSVP